MSCAKPSFFSSGDEPQSRVGLPLGQMQVDLVAGGASEVSACLSDWYRQPQVAVRTIGLVLPLEQDGVQLSLAGNIEWVAARFI
jgi:hypothetical protein